MKRKSKFLSILIVVSLVVLGLASAAWAAGVVKAPELFPLPAGTPDSASVQDTGTQNQPANGNLQVKLPAGWQLVFVPSVGMELLFPSNPVSETRAEVPAQASQVDWNQKNNKPNERKWEIKTPNTRFWNTRKWNNAAAQTRPVVARKAAVAVPQSAGSFTQSIGFRWSEPASGDGLQAGSVSTPVVVIYSTPSNNAGKIYTIRIYLPDGNTGGTRTIDINISFDTGHPGLRDLHFAGIEGTPESIPAPDLKKLLSSTSLFD
jgi:hypothetical protein